MSTRRRDVVSLVAWIAFLGASLAALHAVSAGPPAPALTRLGQVGDWLGQHRPAEVVFALLRLVALLLAWYLLALTVGGLLARALRLAALFTVMDALTLPAVRRLVSGAAGLSVTATALSGPLGPAVVAAAEPPPVATMRRLPDGAAPAPPTRPGETMRLLPEEAAPPPPPAATPRTWTVRPGDHFWSIAEQVLAEAWGRPPSDGEVSPYWRSLVAANRQGLRDARNPDLLFAGQVLVVPTPPPKLNS